MTEMVDRVSRAIERTFDEDCARVFDEGQAETLARAAIEAMREPTEGMCEAGQKVNNLSTDAGTFEFLSHDEMTMVWQIMIDEALK